MTETPDDVITDLIAAIVAARADGEGVLTIAAVRARLQEAELQVQRVRTAVAPPYDDDEIADGASGATAKDRTRASGTTQKKPRNWALERMLRAALENIANREVVSLKRCVAS